MEKHNAHSPTSSRVRSRIDTAIESLLPIHTIFHLDPPPPSHFPYPQIAFTLFHSVSLCTIIPPPPRALHTKTQSIR